MISFVLELVFTNVEVRIMNKKGLIITIIICCAIVVAGVATVLTVNGLKGSKEQTKVTSTSASTGTEEKFANGFKYSDKDNKITILSTEIEEGTLEIPDEINGMPVVKIGYNAFTGKGISEVVIPDSVEVIEKNAFDSCSGLTKITLPASLKLIENNAFANCSGLTEVIFNNQLEEIGKSAFYACSGLKEIKLPDSVKIIGNNCFQNCTGLENFICSNELTQIGQYAFSACSKLQNISFNKKLLKIGKGAFVGNKELTSVKLPNSIKSLGDRLFYECTKLENVTLPKNLTMIPIRAFQYCSALKKVTLPKKTIIIKKAAFSDCANLEKVVFNDKLIAIGDQAFSGNKKMKAIQLKNKVRFIGNSAFRDTLVEKIKLSKNLAYIGNGVFSGCSELKVVNIPAKVKGINLGAFRDCKSLSAINVAAENEHYSSIGGVLYDKEQTTLLNYPANKKATIYTSPAGMTKIRAQSFRGNKYLQTINVSAKKIKRYAFAEMKNLRNVTINDNDTIELNAFYDNDKLQTVTINENRLIGFCAFADCKRLKTVNIVKSEIIGSSAFEECENLTVVTLPEGLRRIKSYAFWGANIRTINIPSSLTELYGEVFTNNKNLEAFTGGSAKYVVEDGILYNYNKSVLIKYPAQKKGNTFEVPDSVVRLKNKAFERNPYLKTLYLGVNCNRLANYAITKCNKLKTIMFYATQISKVSRDAFNGCKNLSIVVGPNNRGLKYATEAVEASFISCG